MTAARSRGRPAVPDQVADLAGYLAAHRVGHVPHIHTSVGLKEHSATVHTSHLLAATVQFLTEMIIVEVDTPEMTRPRDHDLYDVPLLRFG